MNAYIYTRYGPPEVLQKAIVKKPEPKKDEVLIKVFATTVNHTDTGIRSAQYFISRFFSGLLKPKNQILGCEFAGEVVAIGSGVDEYKIKDRVFGFDDQNWGGYAQFKTMKTSKMIAKIPDSLTYEQAAPATEGAHYALFYIRGANISKDSKVLINSATGAIGSAATQIIRKIGADITATSSTKNINLVKRLGANKVIDYEKLDFTDTEEKYDVIFDAVGKSSWKKCKPLLKEDGVYMSSELGDYAQNPFLAIWTKFFSKKKVLFPIPSNKKQDVEYLKKLIEDGDYIPVIDKVYELNDIVEATKYVESGQKTGNVVIKIS